MTGFSYEDTVNYSFKDLDLWKNHDDRVKLMDIVANNGFAKNFEAEFVRKNGTVFLGLMSCGLFDMNDKTYMLTITRDITERKEYEKKLETAKTIAEENDKLKSAFLANMSHEIRTPMNGIIGFAEMLRNDDKFNDDDKESLDIICKSGNQLLKIVNDILDISKIEVGQFKIIERECNLKKMMNELYILFNTEIKTKKKDIDLKYRISNSGFSSNVLLDELRIRQILMNILNNALKFTES